MVDVRRGRRARWARLLEATEDAMDPQACFEGWLAAVVAGDLDAAAEFAESYAGWLRIDGCPAEWRETAVERLDCESDRFLCGDAWVDAFVAAESLRAEGGR